MISKEHNKHSDIVRPIYGSFGRHEWAIVGTDCNVTRAFASEIIKALSPSHKCGYADAHHPAEGQEGALPGMLAAGAVVQCSDNSSNYEFHFAKPFNKFRLRTEFSDADIVFVNGNHAEATSQILVIDRAKGSSLEKKLAKLTNVKLILLKDDSEEIADVVREAIPGWEQVPIYRLTDSAKIVHFFRGEIENARPILNGLVLAGGKSVRMGHDKSLIEWHGKKHRYFVSDMLQTYCEEVFISCRPGQQNEIDNKYKVLEDTFTGLGPYGAVLSAFREQPDAAWLVVACDLPLLDMATLQFLCSNRNASAVATTFESPFDHLPEPLISIWEPRSYPALLSFLSQGYTCPRKVLRNTDVCILQPPDAEALMNVNTPEESNRVKSIIQQKRLQNHAE